MRFALLISLSLLASCAHQETVKLVERPAWIEGIRSGSESLKSSNGSKTFYRRIAGTKDMGQQSSCDLAVIRVSEDIKKDYPLLPVIPHSIEVLVYDPHYGDCAVTASVNASVSARSAELKAFSKQDELRKRGIASKEEVSEDEATELLQHRSETATRYALTGMTKGEFEQFAKDKVYMNIGGSACSGTFKTENYSIHGSTHICWRGENILGYCTSRDGQCWTKVP